MKRIFIAGSFILFAVITQAQNVGIGITSPKAKLNIVGNPSSPSIPGATTSTAIFRIGINTNDGIDIGKLALSPNSAWMQAGYDGLTPDPLSLQPLGGNVGIGILSPASSAKLDISSTTQGFLPPRMTSAQREAITPAEGLIIYNTTLKKPNFYDGAEWRNFDGNSVYTIGDNYRGGIIAYILQPGDPGYNPNVTHGLIAATSDQSAGAQWGCIGTAIPGADGIALGTGNQNTIDIMAGCATAGIAARLCGDLVLNGYSDWYLPSIFELEKLYINRVAVGGFASIYYWSSSEFDSGSAWFHYFIGGSQFNVNKNGTYGVRAVRTF